MSSTYEERLSDSPFVHNFSVSRAEDNGMSSVPADGSWYMFVMKVSGRPRIAIGGPLTKVLTMPIAAETEWIGARFTLGTYMPHLPVKGLIDSVAFLPMASSKSFYLKGSVWEIPTPENIDVFTDRLIREELLVRDPVVSAVMRDQPADMSLRSVQRRFLSTTGLTQEYIRQIERARRATALLQQGYSILDTVHEVGYFDQPHMTRSLKNLTGFTPAQLIRQLQP